MNELKQLIKNYQENQNEEIIDRILSYVDEDLMEYKYDENEEAPDNEDVDPLIYIAYRIRASLLKSCFKERNLKQLYETSDEDKDDYEGLYEWFGDLQENPWVGVNMDELRKFNFRSVWNNRTKIKKLYGGQAHDLFYLCKKFRGLSQDSWEFLEDFNNTKNKLLPFYVEALKYALNKVDAERNEKEIVKYINLAGLMTKFIEVQMDDSGTKRIKSEGKSYYIKPVFGEDIESEAWMIILGKSLKFIGADAFNKHLTKSQKGFLSKVYGVVKEEIENENVEAFWWNKDGKPYLKKTYLAEKMGITEGNFRKTLKRITDKIHSNWKEVFGEFYKSRKNIS